MVSVCLPSDALSQHLASHLGFSYLGHGVSLHGCPRKVQSLLLTLDKVTPPDLECGVTPLCPPAPMKPQHMGEAPERRSPCLEEAQAGVEIARRNIDNLRYADDTTLMAESEGN